MSKRFYWLKLHDDFFYSKRIKKLRKMAGGDTYTIIYLKMQLLALKTDGILHFSGLEDNFAEELALDICEDPENVRVTLLYLLSCGLAETSDDINFFLPYVVENTGSENESTQRVREHRERQRALQCNNNALHCNGEIEIEKRDRDRYNTTTNTYPTLFSARESAGAGAGAGARVGEVPTLEEVRAYAAEIRSLVDTDRFFDWYEKSNWRGVVDWREKLREWEKRDDEEVTKMVEEERRNAWKS